MRSLPRPNNNSRRNLSYAALALVALTAFARIALADVSEGMLAVAAAQGPPQKVSAEEASSSEETSSASSKEADAQPTGELVPNAPFIFIPKADDPAQATHMVTAMLGEQLNQIASLADKVREEKKRKREKEGERKRERERKR